MSVGKLGNLHRLHDVLRLLASPTLPGLSHLHISTTTTCFDCWQSPNHPNLFTIHDNHDNPLSSTLEKSQSITLPGRHVLATQTFLPSTTNPRQIHVLRPLAKSSSKLQLAHWQSLIVNVIFWPFDSFFILFFFAEFAVYSKKSTISSHEILESLESSLSMLSLRHCPFSVSYTSSIFRFYILSDTFSCVCKAHRLLKKV